MTLEKGEVPFDLIVLGAGPAGSAAAATAAKHGLRCALIDKHTFPREKLCGGGVTGRSMTHARRIFGNCLGNTPLETRSRIAFHAFGEDLGLSEECPEIYLGMRRSFDAALVRQAIGCGAKDFTGKTAALNTDSPSLTIEGKTIHAPIVIAADGVNSPTARQMFGSAFDKSQIGFALEIETPEVDPDMPLRIDFGAAHWGYGWQFPKTCGTTIGVGGVWSRNPDMKSSLMQYLEQLGVDAHYKVKGQYLPFGAFREIPGHGRILLAGDAAGLVDPITGEGIAHALHSGELAAKAAISALHEGHPDRALAKYTQYLRPVHKGLRHARMLRHLMFREELRPAFIRSFRRSRTLRNEYLRLLAGETEYSELMLKMAARLPRFAFRAISGR